MTRGERDELQAARALCGDVPLLAALDEWLKVRTLTQGNPLAAAEAWAARDPRQAHIALEMQAEELRRIAGRMRLTQSEAATMRDRLNKRTGR